ncbi:hypothetical protein G6F68_021438 [Rhizopus microsporus]|nr:hypothetical protein G6F68_021438 [Rhizopus microsporus]
MLAGFHQRTHDQAAKQDAAEHHQHQRQADSDGRHEQGGEQQDGGVGLGRQEHDEACRGIAAESIEGAVGDVQDAHHTEHQG